MLFIAIVLRWLAGAAYVRAVATGKAKPHIVSWFFWGLTALIAFGIQLSQGAGPAAFISLALAVGPILVCILAVAKGLHRMHLTVTDKTCAVLTLVGIVFWVTTRNPLMALWMSVVVDFISSVPTIVKCYLRPHTEQVLPYGVSMLSMVIALAGTSEWTTVNALFPAYILFINTVFTTVLVTRLRSQVLKFRQLWAHWQYGAESGEQALPLDE